MAKLAINGGEPVVRPALGKSWPIFDEKEEKALVEQARAVLEEGGENSGFRLFFSDG